MILHVVPCSTHEDRYNETRVNSSVCLGNGENLKLQKCSPYLWFCFPIVSMVATAAMGEQILLL